MNLEQAIKAVLSSMIVCDPEDHSRAIEQYNRLKDRARYLDFQPGPPSPIPFKTEAVHVLIPGDGKNSFKHRELRQSDGRREFSVSSLQVKHFANIPIHMAEQEDSSWSLPLSQMADRFAIQIDRYALSLLNSFCVGTGKVMTVTSGNPLPTLKSEVKKMGRCSVISPRSQVPKIWDPDSRRHVGGDGEICEALFIPENEFFILSDDSSRVNVRIDAEPRIFVSSEGPGSVQLAIIGEFGFYLPGDIRATKVEVA